MKIKLLILISLFVLNLMILAAWGGGCGENQRIDNDAISKRKTIKLDTPIYFFEGGRFFKTSFNNNSRQLISNRGTMTGGLQLSQDGRYIIYRNSGSKENYFIYDAKKNTDRKFFEMPAHDSAKIVFSPDSLKIAILNVSYPHRQSLTKEGVFVFDLNKLNYNFFTYPTQAKLKQRQVIGSEIQWSSDGKYLYLAFNEGAYREYHKLDVKRGIYQNINGKYDEKEFKYSFSEKNTKLQIYAQKVPQSGRGFDSLFSKDNKLSAKINDKFELMIFQKNQKPIVLSKGYYDKCMGVTIRILAWISNDYLVFQKEENTYMFDVRNRKKIVLFGSNVSEFVWLD